MADRQVNVDSVLTHLQQEIARLNLELAMARAMIDEMSREMQAEEASA